MAEWTLIFESQYNALNAGRNFTGINNLTMSLIIFFINSGNLKTHLLIGRAGRRSWCAGYCKIELGPFVALSHQNKVMIGHRE
jgi:hypothetical protein